MRKCVTLQHFRQRADFVFFWFWLNNCVNECAAENIIERREVQLIHTFWDAGILNERRSLGIAREIDSRAIRR